MRISHIIIGISILLFTACGEQNKAEKLVDSFMEENLIDASKLNDVDYKKIDSTKIITDSIVNILRKTAENIPHYKQNIKYTPGEIGNKLIITRVTYSIDTQKYQDTYYLDAELTRVVAFKNN
jgi:hypothetical protein